MTGSGNHLGRIRAVFDFSTTHGQAQIVDLAVDVTDRSALDGFAFFAQIARTRMFCIECCAIRRIDDPARHIERENRADEDAPFLTLDQHQPVGTGARGDVVIRHPFKIIAVEIIIADAVKRAVGKAAIGDDLIALSLRQRRQGCCRGAIAFGAQGFTGDDAAFNRCHDFQGLGPESRKAVPEDEAEEAGDHQQTEGERAAHGPDHRFAARGEVAAFAARQREATRRRRTLRVRTCIAEKFVARMCHVNHVSLE